MTIGLVLASIMHELNTAERICLTKLRDDIVEDLEPKFVLPYIVKEGIFSEEESADVLKQDTIENKVRRLLDILCTKGASGYAVFIRALEEDGNYGWIAKKLNMMHDKIKQEIVFMHKVLQNGGVPFALVHLVHRPGLVMEIRNALRCLCTGDLRHNGAVVVHGMMGCGKSVLAAEALRNPQLLDECFPNGVYWIPIGKLREPNDLLLKMHLQLDSLEVGSHKDVLTVEMASCRLKRWCLNTKALLVLDDVWSDKVITAFNVGCPLLVTTRDISVVDVVRMHKISVEVQEGLTSDETKQLFASVFGVATDMVPSQVDDIHRAHRGLPLLMANMAAVLQPYANCPEKWEPYIQARTGQRVRHGSGSGFDSSLELILGSLDEDVRGYFKSFALFLEDIDIPSLVFEVLWDMDSVSVEHIMDILVKKSLVRKEPVHDSYTYGIHDLYLSFLKRRSSSDSLKDRHRQFVEKLLKRWKPWEMPCRRNYFFCYLGYHLDAAGMGQELRDIFLDLRFVERKVQCIGPTDLVNDLHRYEHQFRFDPQVAKERQDMQRFLQPNVHFLSGRDADVIQLALREPRSSSVHVKALQLAQQRVNWGHEAPYFEWTNIPDTRSQAAVRMKHEKGGVNYAEFSPDDSMIASAGEDGSVRLWQSQSGNQLQVLRPNQPGDTSDSDACSVNFCTFSPDGHHLASASSDCKLYLWNINAGLKSAPASPMTVPSRPARRTDSRKSSACATFAEVQHSAPVLCCAFSADGKLLASGDERGCVKLHRIVKWEVVKEVESAVPQQSRAVRCCCFTRDSRRLVLTLGGHEVLIWELFPPGGKEAQAAETRLPQILVHEDCAVVDCCLSHGQRLVSTTRQQLISAAGQHVWTWDLQNPSQSSARRYNGFWMSYNLTCCAVSPDGSLIAAGTSLRAILLWDADTRAALGSFKGDAEDVKSVRFSHDGAQLVSASSDGTVVVWDRAECRRCSRAALMPVLDVVFDERGPLVASVDETGILQISSGLNTKLEAKHALGGSENNNRCEEVSCCCFTHDREALVLGTKNGHVSLFKLGSKECLALGNHNSCVTSILAWPDGLAISGSLDATVKMWHKDGTHITLSGHQGQITAPCRLFGDGSSRLLSSSNTGELLIWNLTSPYELLARIGAPNGSAVLCCDVSPDGQFILSGSADESVQLWKSGQLWNLDANETLDACVRCCRFGLTSRGVIAAAGTDNGSVYMYSLDEKTWQKVGQHNLKSWVWDLAFSPDGHQLASLSESICWWSLDLEPEWAAHSPEDCGSIASGDSQSGHHPHRLQRRFQLQSSRATALFVSRDFGTFVTADDSGILYVLNKVVAEEEG